MYSYDSIFDNHAWDIHHFSSHIFSQEGRWPRTWLQAVSICKASILLYIILPTANDSSGDSPPFRLAPRCKVLQSLYLPYSWLTYPLYRMYHLSWLYTSGRVATYSTIKQQLSIWSIDITLCVLIHRPGNQPTHWPWRDVILFIKQKTRNVCCQTKYCRVEIAPEGKRFA